MSKKRQDELAAAIEKATQEPGHESHWDQLEKISQESEQPESCAQAYRTALAGDIEIADALAIAERAVRFHEEWFGENPTGIRDVLQRILVIEPGNEWAFQQLTMVLTVAECWDEVLALFDGAIASATEKNKRVKLLDEAYQIAKDLANKPERAIEFLRSKLAVAPDAGQVQALERLLEKHERWSDLIALWSEQLPTLNQEQQQATWLRMGRCQLEQLGSPERSLDALRELVETGAEGQEVDDLMEAIATGPNTVHDVREAALVLVRQRYEAMGRADDVVRVLQQTVALVPIAERKALHLELGRRMHAGKDHAGALVQYAELLCLDPDSQQARRALHEEAKMTGDFVACAHALIRAAQQSGEPTRAAALLVDASAILHDEVKDGPAAIAALATALALDNLSDTDTVRVGRRLAGYLAESGQRQQQLSVLETLAAAETGEHRLALIGDIASLAEELGEVDRALAAWRGRLEADAFDARAMDNIVRLLTREERWNDLLAALRQRIANSDNPVQEHGDRVRVAELLEEKLNDPGRALEMWLHIKTRFGDTEKSVTALTRLFSQLERWEDLKSVLKTVSDEQTKSLSERLTILGSTYQASEENKAAIECFRRVLTVDPRHPGARQSLSALLQNPEHRNAVAEALAHSFRATGDLSGLLDLAPARLANSTDPRRRGEILREAADIAEENGRDAEALTYLVQLFPLAPRDRVLEDRLVGLGRKLDVEIDTSVDGEAATRFQHWSAVVEAYRSAVSALGGDDFAVLEMRSRLAGLYEQVLGDSDSALEVLLDVLRQRPDHLGDVSTAARLAAQRRRWSDVALVVSRFVGRSDNVPEGAIIDARESAEVVGELAQLARELMAAVEQSKASSRVASEVFGRIATWYSDRLLDSAGAEAALVRATELDKSREDIHNRLADLQRQKLADEGGPAALYRTLRRLCEIRPDDLNLFAEAAEVARSYLSQEAEESLVALLSRAATAWKGTAPATGAKAPQELVLWATQELSSLYQASDRGHRALDLLIETSRLPFAHEDAAALRISAADIAANVLQDDTAAMEMYRAVLAQKPDSAQAFSQLARLYRRKNQWPELLSLRQRQLTLTSDPSQQEALRLEIPELLDQIENQSGRMDLLRQNLLSRPGHEATIEAMVGFLSQRGRHEELVSVLEEQANVLESSDAPRAASLWERIAKASGDVLGDDQAAIRAYRMAATLAPTLERVDALAQAYTERDQPGAAIPWLEQAVNRAEVASRPALIVRLSQAQLAIDKREEAVATLERALLELDGPTLVVREMLAQIHREAKDWIRLSATLSEMLPHLSSNDAIAEVALEVARIGHDRLGSPAAALPALQRAIELVPGDGTLKTMLATSYRAAGRLEDARVVLTEQIAEFGRRRSKERALVHVELGLLARAEGNYDAAIEELELAGKMDTSNADILRRLAEVAREANNLEKAEKSLRQMLLLVRRQPPGTDLQTTGISEVLYELHAIATARDQADKATELLESTFEAAAVSDYETLRLVGTLRSRNQVELAHRALVVRANAQYDGELTDLATRAELFDQLAQLLEGPLDDPNGAFDAKMKSIAYAPDNNELHDRARVLAGQIDRVGDYVSGLEHVLKTRCRRAEDAAIASRLLLRAGQVIETDLDDAKRALEFYRQAEGRAVVPTQVLPAIARVAAILGDTLEQTRALDALATLAIAEGPTEAQADALYNLAELQAAAPDMIARCVEVLTSALKTEPRFAQAGRILDKAADTSGNDASVLQLFEDVARKSGDNKVLFDYLNRLARIGRANPEEIKEAVGLSRELKRPQDGAGLLRQAVEQARNGAGIETAAWAVMGLAGILVEDGKLENARDLLFEVADSADGGDVDALGVQLAQQAVARGALALAAEVYEFLRGRDPSARKYWEPLLGLLRDLNDGARFTSLVDATLPTLVDAEERNALRMEKANYLVALDRGSDAIDVLREALFDDPDNLVASRLLEDVLRSDGNEQALAEFLGSRFEEAVERGNVETITDVALRLSATLGEVDGESSIRVLRDGIAAAGDERRLLLALLDGLGQHGDVAERADLHERLLRSDSGDEVASRTFELLGLREALEDSIGAQRALEIGFEMNPHADSIRERLQGWYQDTAQIEPLAHMLLRQAHVAGPAQSVGLLRQVAAMYRDSLANNVKAREVLEAALERAPGDLGLVAELAACYRAEGDNEKALRVLGQALEHADGTARLDLLVTRADIAMALSSLADAREDLEEAYAIAPETVIAKLNVCLERGRIAARESGDAESERSTTLRLVALNANAAGNDARNLLLDWIEREPNDREALVLLRDGERAAERWDGVVAACSRLCEVERGDAQIDAALQLAEAADKAASPGFAVQGLEIVHRAQPEDDRVRDLLRKFYQEAGAYRELATLLLADADHTADPAKCYEKLRTAADLFVNYLGDAVAAIEPAQRAKDLRPDDHETVVLLADILIASGQIGPARDMLQPAIDGHKRRSPELAALLYRMAKVVATTGDKSEQLAWLKKAFDVDRKDGLIASELAHLATELGDYDLALKPLRAITLMESPGPVNRVMALLWEAKIEHARGNRAKAELWAKKALREDPSYAEAEEFLAQIQQ